MMRTDPPIVSASAVAIVAEDCVAILRPSGLTELPPNSMRMAQSTSMGRPIVIDVVQGQEARVSLAAARASSAVCRNHLCFDAVPRGLSSGLRSLGIRRIPCVGLQPSFFALRSRHILAAHSLRHVDGLAVPRITLVASRVSARLAYTLKAIPCPGMSGEVFGIDRKKSAASVAALRRHKFRLNIKSALGQRQTREGWDGFGNEATKFDKDAAA